MIEICDFRKSSGKHIPDIVEYVKDYMKTHNNIDVIVGTDSQVHGPKTTFSTVIGLYDCGDGQYGHGMHCITHKWYGPKYTKEQKLVRLDKEVEESVNVAMLLRDHGIKVKYIDIDISPNPKHKSSQAHPGAVARVTGNGFDYRDKSHGACVTRFADFQVKK